MKLGIALVLAALWTSPSRAAECSADDVRRAVAVAANSASQLLTTFERCRASLLARDEEFFKDLDEDQIALIWSVSTAHRYRPYGSSMAFSLPDLLKEKHLDCDNYVFLTIRLFRLLRPHSKLDIDMVGWERGPVGNHAQIVVNHDRVPLMLDPTVGLIAKISFDDLASGKKVEEDDLLILSRRDDPPGFRDRVRDAVLFGGYRPSHILYYFSDVDDYPTALATVNKWPTPAIQERAR